MAWSTRQLAELAGTSLRTVRHYHDVGLLAEPERRSNGYKRYGVEHLVRLLRIKRLTELGFSLSQIATMGEADEHPEEALHTLDAELATTIDRLERARAELAVLLRQGTPTDLPPEFADRAVTARLAPADRAFAVVMTRVLGPAAINAYREVVRSWDPGPAVAELDRLPPDADERTRADLAALLVPYVDAVFTEHPELQDVRDTTVGPRQAQQAIGAALRELYNDAQLDVLRRVEQLRQAAAR